MLVCGVLVVDDGVLLVHAARLQPQGQRPLGYAAEGAGSVVTPNTHSLSDAGVRSFELRYSLWGHNKSSVVQTETVSYGNNVSIVRQWSSHT